jgi:hypothetical protein
MSKLMHNHSSSSYTVYYIFVGIFVLYSVTKDLTMVDLFDFPSSFLTHLFTFIVLSVMIGVSMLMKERIGFAFFLFCAFVSSYVFHFSDVAMYHPNASWNYVLISYDGYLGRITESDLFFGSDNLFTGYVVPVEFFVGMLAQVFGSSLTVIEFYDYYRYIVLLAIVTSFIIVYRILIISNSDNVIMSLFSLLFFVIAFMYPTYAKHAFGLLFAILFLMVYVRFLDEGFKAGDALVSLIIFLALSLSVETYPMWIASALIVVGLIDYAKNLRVQIMNALIFLLCVAVIFKIYMVTSLVPNKELQFEFALNTVFGHPIKLAIAMAFYCAVVYFSVRLLPQCKSSSRILLLLSLSGFFVILLQLFLGLFVDKFIFVYSIWHRGFNFFSLIALIVILPSVISFFLEGLKLKRGGVFVVAVCIAIIPVHKFSHFVVSGMLSDVSAVEKSLILNDDVTISKSTFGDLADIIPSKSLIATNVDITGCGAISYWLDSFVVTGTRGVLGAVPTEFLDERDIVNQFYISGGYLLHQSVLLNPKPDYILKHKRLSSDFYIDGVVPVYENNEIVLYNL